MNDVHRRLNEISVDHNQQLLSLHINKLWKVLSTGEDYRAIATNEPSSNETADSNSIIIDIMVLISFIINGDPNDLNNIE